KCHVISLSFPLIPPTFPSRFPPSPSPFPTCSFSFPPLLHLVSPPLISPHLLSFSPSSPLIRF
ncbi:unnamed protein product, partial [Closterium sp. Naga37s-1]